ncbi:DLL [Mytilus edulis]|uniref:DLL n=1 Tax=Mytilus edulis TaxID=6550 RepID=A0A8S3RP31_MYTED|nr:DLL [Mytilus edulis]
MVKHVILMNTILCTVKPGFYGTHCHHHDCAGKPCNNGGTCHNEEHNFVCTCPPGFKGTHCHQVNIFTTHSDDNCSSQRGHARWVPDKENRFIETLVSDVTKFDEISLLLSEDSSTDPKERINTAVDKICDLFKSTANRVFKPKGRFYPSGTSNQLWFNKQCRDKRKGFHKAKNRYSLNKNKENRDEMKKSGKVYRTEMNKSFESFQHALESDMRKLSKKDSAAIIEHSIRGIKQPLVSSDIGRYRGRVNKYGNMLIELCKRSGIYICNGRLFADKHIGCTTCKDASLVDYLIMSPCMFDITSDFGIVDFNPMFSDVHNRLYFSFSFPSSNSLNNSHNHTINSNTYIRWDSTKTDDFTQVLTNDTGSSLQQLNDILNSIEIDTATSESVNGLVNDLGRVLLDTAETVFGSNEMVVPLILPFLDT